MRDALFGTAHALAAWAPSLPLIYQGLVREHAYGLATQGFAAWAGEQWIALGINTLLTALAVAVLYTPSCGALADAGRRWWAWGAGAAVAGLALLVMAGPVFIDPLFNTYRSSALIVTP